MISIHAAREGGDNDGGDLCKLRKLFQSTPPVKAATEILQRSAQCYLFQSTPPVKAATRYGSAGAFFEIISIHAAREGGDTKFCNVQRNVTYFNPRRP